LEVAQYAFRSQRKNRMPVIWYAMRERSHEKPFDGAKYLLAVPQVTSGNPDGLDQNRRYSLHVAAWDTIGGRWVISEVGEDRGEAYTLAAGVPSHWAELHDPA
jgi:hypothetical protein